MTPLIAWALARVSTRMTFHLAAKAGQLQKRIENQSERSRQIVRMELSERRAEIEILEKGLEKPRAQMGKLNALGETLLGLAMMFVTSAIWGNSLDFAIGIMLLVSGEITTICAVRYFFAEYFGPALLLTQLQGRRPPLPP